MIHLGMCVWNAQCVVPVPAKETHLSAKEAHLSTKETHLSTKQTHVRVNPYGWYTSESNCVCIITKKLKNMECVGPQICKRDPSIRKRDPFMCKTLQIVHLGMCLWNVSYPYLHKRCIYLQQRPIYLQNRPIIHKTDPCTCESLWMVHLGLCL